ncbi:MAG: hypothetical protein QOG85_832 [Gaiellaceae bacterium]|jgi:hypothetical protein|nr:hypothetical protein [Gaiellaceae bacterium]
MNIPTDREIRAKLDELAADGDFERSIGADGEPQYKMTPRGKAKVEAMLREYGIDPDALRKDPR